MSENFANQNRISNHIKEHPDCKQSRTLPLILQGQRKDLDVYRMPLDLLYFNIHNGRFAAEYRELVASEGGELDPTKQKDAKKIKNLLLNLDKGATEVTKQDILKRGQWRDGVITHDGYVIDGNRRMAILTSLSEDGTDGWKYINVARLPPNVTPSDLWKIEAGIQLGREEILSYGPINELLKFKEGVDAGLKPEEIAKTLYGYEDKVDEISKKLDRLKLVQEYLRFIGKPGKYRAAERKHEHFIDLQNILAEAEDEAMSITEMDNIKNIGFSLIQKTRISHLKLRKMKKMLNNVEARAELLKASQYATPTDPKAVVEQPNDPLADLTIETIDPDRIDDDEEPEESKHNPVLTIFRNAEDIMKANEEKDDIESLLTTVRINLSYATKDANNPDLKKDSVKEIVKQILRYSEKLKQYVQL